MKIEMSCRCGSKASWEDNNVAQVRNLSREWQAEHAKCAAVPTAPATQPVYLMPVAEMAHFQDKH